MAEIRARNKNRRSNIALMILSLVIAMLLWVILSVTKFTDTSVRLYDVPIDFSLDGTYAELAGLSVINKDFETVNVSFTGRRDEVSRYTTEDLHIGLDLNNVRASGTYEIPLVVTTVNGNQISDVEIAPQRTIHIEFDHFASKTLSVDSGTLSFDLSGVTAAQGYIYDPSEVVITPSSVTISGPQDYIDQVTSCSIVPTASLTDLKNSVNTNNTQPVLYSESGVFENERVSLNTESFNVSLPVYFTKTVPLDVVITGYTDRVDISNITYELSTDSIAVRSQDSALENLESINLGYIDIRDIYPGYVTTFTIPENSRYTNISGVESVNVSFNLEGYTTKQITLTNSQIHPINGSSDYRVTVEQDRLRVTLCGPEDILEDIDSSSFIAEVDLMDYSDYVGMRMLMVSVYSPSYPQVWASGNYQALASFEHINPVGNTP